MTLAKELRIGNVVEYFTVGKWNEISVTPMSFYICDESPERYRPIPLTEEWLIRLGFKESEPGIYTLNEQVEDSMEGIGFAYSEMTVWREEGKWRVQVGMGEIDIEHVHALQNLRFALTGKELELK